MQMSKNKLYFRNFVECGGVVLIGNNEVFFSYKVKTVHMVTMASEIQHHITLRDVMYNLEVMHNLVSITQAQKNRFMVRVDDDPTDATREWMHLHLKSSVKMTVCVFETREQLYEVVTRVCSNQALITRTERVGL